MWCFKQYKGNQYVSRLLLLVEKIFQGEYTPHPIPYHVLTALILVVPYGYFQIYISSNSIKFIINYILVEYILCFYILLEGICM